ncbi:MULTISPECIES: DNA-processing protein DprA [Hyphomonas]|uniref:DNA-protecting protein DprA n=1 Tax=Hyphomonas adhaerens TaxID=81029 RepID=A0A3B9H1X6_9PROT|nr:MULTISPECIES: DNA-processing protein DprA [Hyphomonas]MBB41725.1 DNA-protecting protein DprA [Hyphomonas sp.]HAE28691.1 DNA-protecting protein DprA [Hyphomonas adhaerens]|tara:strand:+ start:5318 stop:6415 length:1098 start_codon:yes stop_codon:yes gene_type:complete
MMSDGERLNWIRLARTHGIGPVSFFQLLRRFGSAGAALDALPELSKRSRRARPLQPPPPEQVEQELKAVHRYGARIVLSSEPDYPPLLRDLEPPPPVLTVLGNTGLAARPTVAIVGARNASAAGRKIARNMAAELGQNGFSIVSGLALGIDGEAHAASLESGTVAVLGGAVDHVYPPQHQRLYAEIAASGLIVSESPFGYRAKAQDFPRRNRIITGMSMGVVVVEAAERSGSLISARVAGEQGREVMAVPGSPLDPRAAGTNSLLHQGATLVRHADDVLDILATLDRRSVSAPPPRPFEYDPDAGEPSESELQRVVEALSPHPMPIDEIARASSLPAARCAAVLLELELSGEAQTLPGGLAAKAF